MKVKKIKEILESSFTDTDDILDIRELYTASTLTPSLKDNINSKALKHTLVNDFEDLFMQVSENPDSKAVKLKEFKDVLINKAIGELYGLEGQDWLNNKG